MSLNFSRRSFFRLLATAMLTVACLFVMTGCWQDANKPSRTGDGTLTVSSVEANVTKTGTGSFKVVLTNNADNEVIVNASNFNVVVTKSDKTTTSYAATVDATSFALKKNASITVNVTSSASASSGETLTLQYRPRNSYEEVYASWNYQS